MIDSEMAKLVLKREELCQRIEQTILTDSRIIAAYYGGSLAVNQLDSYSDIDLRLVVIEKDYHQFNQFKLALAEQWGNVLFFENQEIPYLLIAHYDNFIKVDIFCYDINKLEPSLWTQELRIIKDTPNSAIKQLIDGSILLKPKTTISDLKSWQTKCFAYYHEIYRRSQRGEYYYTLSCIDNLRQLLIIGWHYQNGWLPNNFGDWAKYQGNRSRLSAAQQTTLLDMFVGIELKELDDVMARFVDEYSAICEMLTADRTLPYSIANSREIFNCVFFRRHN